MENDNSFIYHYTKTENIFKILETLSLKFSSFQKVNDPKESKIWPFKVYCLDSKSKETFEKELFGKLNSFILKNSKILCMTKDNNSHDKVTHYNKGYNHPRMWAQYAENNTGVCLVFDKDEFDNNFETLYKNKINFHREVEYLNSGLGTEIHTDGIPFDPYAIFYEKLLNDGFNNYLYNHIKLHFKSLYYTKHTNWSEENEERYVLINESDNNIFFPIQNSLKGIIITEDFPKEKLDELINVCTRNNLQLQKIIWRGWSTSLFPFVEKKQLSLNFTYTTHIPFKAFFFQAMTFDGEMKTLLMENGTVSTFEDL